MKTLALALQIAVPGVALGAGDGAVQEFGADDWIGKWPVLVVVFCSVAAMTGFLTVKIFGRARKTETKR